MPYIELSETFFGDDWVWTPLEATDNREEVLREFHSTTAEQEGWKKYEQDTEEYERAMSPSEDTPERRAAVDNFKRLLGRR